jgi:N-acetylneuraminic acid mutarotase
MQHKMLLLLSVAALFMACGEAPNGAVGRLTKPDAAATVNSGSFRIDGQLSGTGWTIRSPIPEPLGVAQGATVASGDGSRIYHIGGITGALTATNKVRVYTPADDTWFDAADIPVSTGIRTFGAAVELNGFIYVFGGVDETGVLDTLWIYDEAKDAWYQGANMPGPRFGPAVATDGGIIWVLGGAEGLSVGGESETIWRYDPTVDSWFYYDHIGIRIGRVRSVMLPNGDLYVLGGGFDGNTNCFFNVRMPSSSCRLPIPFGITDAAVATDGVRIYVAGGAGPPPRTAARTQVFDTVSRTWSLGPPMPSGVDNTSGAIANGTLFVMGGYDGASATSVNYSLPLAMLGTRDVISTGSMSPDALKPPNHRELKIDGALEGPSPWSINSPVPEAWGVAQGSTLPSSGGSLIYHIGGWIGSGVYASNRVRVYSPADDTRDPSSMRSPWWDVSSVPVSRGIRSYGSAVELNGFIYIFGGVSGTAGSGEAVLDTTWIYDEANDSWSRGANMPGPRFGPAVATDGEVIWVMGGYIFGPDHNVWRYDPKADAYTTGFAEMPRPLGRIHGVWLPDATVHVFGGGEAGRLDNHLVYNTTLNAWSSAPPIPLGVLDPATVTDGTLIYLAGAPNFFPRGPARTQIFDPAIGTWSEGPRLPPWPGLGGDWGIDNTSGTIGNGVFYVMGGYNGGGTGFFNYSIPLSELSAFNR